MANDKRSRVLAGKYELVSRVGKGGMAIVWKARTLGVAGGPVVAIKRLLVDISADEATLRLFAEEARIGKQLRHPNIVAVLDFGPDDDGVYFLALEWVEGVDFLDYMRSYHQTKRHVPWPAVAAVALQTLEGLKAAHDRVDEMGLHRPVIHRDVTPSNILLGENGLAKLADFGLARAMDRMTQTLPNVVKGKLSYTAPELARGGRASPTSDVFALGVTLWEALAGKRLFAGSTPLEVIKAISAWSIPPLQQIRPDLPPAVARVLLRALERAPEARWQNAGEMLTALEQELSRLPDPTDPGRLGMSVTKARARLKELDAQNPPDPDFHDEPMSTAGIEVDSRLDFGASPGAKRAGSGQFEEEAPTRPQAPKVPEAKAPMVSSLASSTRLKR